MNCTKEYLDGAGGADSRPKISVCVVTYNQEKYIGACLQSLLDQKGDFSFEVIVGDDCSTDGTRSIIEGYASRYPGIVRPIFHARNMGPFENYRVTHKSARGEYVAHLDGDDSALPGKLAAQAQFLENRIDCAGVFHQLEMVDAEGGYLNRLWPEESPSSFDLKYLLLNHPIVGHSSLMYRRGMLENILEASYKFIDFRIYIELAMGGRLGMISRPLGLYTAGVGISSANSWLPQVMEAIDRALEVGVPIDIVNKARSRQLFKAALNSYYREDLVKFRELIERSEEFGLTSSAQRFFYLMRRSPAILRFVDGIRKALQHTGVVGDAKMRFSQ